MKTVNKTKAALLFSLAMIAALLLSACGPEPTPAPTQDISSVQTQAAEDVIAQLTLSAPPPPPPTAAPTEAPPPPGPTPDPNIPVAVLPKPADGEPAAVANYNTTIYGGPGTDYVTYAAFTGSSIAKVVGKSEDGLWWAVSIPVAPTGAGWVDGGWVTVTNADNVPVLPTPPVPPTTDMVPPGPTDPQVKTLTNTYVRSGPATNYPAYGIAPAGVTGRVIGKSEDGQWWAVRINPEKVGAGYGWVMGQYVQANNVEGVQTIQNPDTHTSVPPSPPPAADAPSATAVEPVNVRTGPGTNYPVLGVAPAGGTAEVSGKSADGAWWQIKIPPQYAANAFGWVSASYVTTQNTGSVPVVDAPPAPPVVGPTPPPPSGTGCSLVAQNPADATQFTIGTPFNTTWVLQNTGTTKWDQGEVDVRYMGAAANIPLHQGSDVYDLVTNVEPSGTYNFTVPMIAPFEPGTYGELWEVAMGSQQLCQFYVYITVP